MSRTRAFVAAVAASLVLMGVPLAWAESSTSPPTELHKVGDHWTPWSSPEAGPDDYIIQKGDTLWDLSEQWFSDPLLWPQIWDENRYILDSHWIYPGDPLVVPGRPTVVPETGELPIAQLTPTEPVGTEREATAQTQPPPVVIPERPLLVPAGDPTDLYCSGYIRHMNDAPELVVAGNEFEGQTLGEGHVIYLDHGRDAGIRAGDEFAVLRRHHHVRHPVSGNDMGMMMKQLGRVRVLIPHDTTSTAIIAMSCEDIKLGDELVPWTTIQAPLLSEVPPFDRLDVSPSGGAMGHVVAVRDDISVFATGHMIFTDLGVISGVQPGDTLSLFREAEGSLPRTMLGRAVVLTVHEGSSMAKIMVSARESEIGDRVEITR